MIKTVFINFVIILFLIPFSFSIVSNPDSFNLGEAKNIHQQLTLTLENNENIPLHISLFIDPQYSFLKKHIKIEPNLIEIMPSETKNVIINLNIDKVFPQKYYVKVLGYINEWDKNIALTSINFWGDGIPNPSIIVNISKIEFSKETIIIYCNFYNNGNVFLLLKPSLKLFHNDSLIKDYKYPVNITILPSQKINYSFRIEHEFKNYEKYRINLTIYFWDYKRVSINKEFIYSYKEQKKVKKKHNLIFFIIPILGIIFGMLYLIHILYEIKNRSTLHSLEITKIKYLEEKTRKLEKEVEKLIKEANKILSFIS